MRIAVDIDDELMQRAAALAGTTDQRELIENALSLLISTREHRKHHPAHGHMLWEDTDDDTPIV
ncbi:MAG: type II toxin-antitoxin system VapB family antitoxin [Gammaproteobacteria bacterium]